MIRVILDHIPDVADQDFECGTPDEAVEVLREYGVRATSRAVMIDGEINPRRGGTIRWEVKP
jgi:sulfur carrier protein ThiS